VKLIDESIQRKAATTMTAFSPGDDIPHLPTARPAAEVVFRARGVSVSFGGVRAVAGVDLEIEAGELVGLIGPNGAGKTTFIDAITGFVRSEGTVELGQTTLNRLPPHVRAQRGLARTWQTVELFDDLTVRENLTVAAVGAASPGAASPGGTTPRAPRWPARWKAKEGASVEDELALLDLVAAADAMPAELTQAERKRAGIGRALVAKPRLLCLDEPAAGLDTRQSTEFGALLPGIARTGTAVLLVDHDMGLVLSVCDRVVVLESGGVIAQGTPAEIRGDERVIAAYLGHASAGAA
jgi:branched-chain amino acid transport system ATP-binding protein